MQQRWKTARDAYVRCKATLNNVPSGSGGRKRKTYVYFEFMKFLDNKRELNTEDSILSNEEPNQRETAGNEGAVVSHPTGNEGADVSHPTGNDGAVVSQPTGNQGSVESQPSTSDSYNINLNNPRPASNRGRNFLRAQRKKNRIEDEFDREMLSFFKENAKVMQNDDMAFFSSLLPITNTFSIEQKLLFRQAVLEKAYEISRLDSDRPATSNSFSVSSDSQHSNFITMYPVVQSPIQTLPGQPNFQQTYLVEEPSSNIEQTYSVEEQQPSSQQFYTQTNNSSNQNSVMNDFLTFNKKI